MNCAQCGPQTDVSAPGAGAAAAKHHRDMMLLVWPCHPRSRDNGRTAAAGALGYGGFTSQRRAQSRLAPDASHLPAALIATFTASSALTH
jgi:hypothetical protein